jgi:hypothetical protein
MNILTEPGGIVCGGIQIIMGRVSPWWPGKMYKAQEKTTIGSHQPEITKQGSTPQTLR